MNLLLLSLPPAMWLAPLVVQYHIVPGPALSLEELVALPYLDRLPTLMNKQPLLVRRDTGPRLSQEDAGCLRARVPMSSKAESLRCMLSSSAPLPFRRSTASMDSSSWPPPAARLQTWPRRSPWEGAARSCWRWLISLMPCCPPTPAGRWVHGLGCAELGNCRAAGCAGLSRARRAGCAWPSRELFLTACCAVPRCRMTCRQQWCSSWSSPQQTAALGTARRHQRRRHCKHSTRGASMDAGVALCASCLLAYSNYITARQSQQPNSKQFSHNNSLTNSLEFGGTHHSAFGQHSLCQTTVTTSKDFQFNLFFIQPFAPDRRPSLSAPLSLLVKI